MNAVNWEGIDTHLDKEEDGAPQDKRLVTEGTVLQQSDGVGAKHCEERVHHPHEEAEEPMTMPPPAWAKQLDEDLDQGAEEDEDFHAQQPAFVLPQLWAKVVVEFLNPMAPTVFAGYPKFEPVHARGGGRRTSQINV